MNSSEETTKTEDRARTVYFCCCCFATDEGGSWGHEVIAGPSGTLCTNCGAGGSAFPMPFYAAKSIREQASWVGKRYYPHEEDTENREERKRLLALVPDFPGRTARPVEHLNEDGEFEVQPGQWWVKQKAPGKSGWETTINGETAEEAIENSRFSSLTYYTEESLHAQEGS